MERRVSNRVKDAQHKATTALVKNNDVIYIDDLNLKGMTKSAKGTVEQPGVNVKAKSGLNRVMLEQAHGQFEQLLVQKTTTQKRICIKVPTAGSSQECSECGYRNPDNRKTQALFECQECHHIENADTNASKVTTQRGQQTLVERINSGEIDLKDYNVDAKAILNTVKKVNDKKVSKVGKPKLTKHSKYSARDTTVGQTVAGVTRTLQAISASRNVVTQPINKKHSPSGP